jgi:hypothetical protein
MIRAIDFDIEPHRYYIDGDEMVGLCYALAN